MICPNDHTPMKTIDGSETGEMTDAYYLTEEIKICPTCGKKSKKNTRQVCMKKIKIKYAII